MKRRPTRERRHRQRATLLGLPGAARLIVREPWLLGWLVLYLAVTFGLEFAILAAVGRVDAFRTWAIAPWLISISVFTDRVLARAKQVATLQTSAGRRTGARDDGAIAAGKIPENQ